MNSALDQLRLDHKNFKQLYQYLAQQIELYQINQCNDPYLFTILDILDYISEFPERYHHPVEDIIYSQLLTRYPKYKTPILLLENEHLLLENLTQLLIQQVGSLTDQSEQSVDQWIEDVKLYMTQQLEHAEREEELIFPLLEQTFNHQDWQQINHKLDHLNQRIGAHQNKSQCAALLNDIMLGQALDNPRKHQWAQN